jgi:hypothetical protein
MRWLPLAFSALLAGCAGNVADYVGAPSDIITPELARYGLGTQPSRCVGAQLGARLTPLQLRRFQRVAALVQRGYFDPARLTLRDLMHVASTMSDPQVRLELGSATAQCGLAGEAVAALPPAAAAAAAAPVARAEAWLNLGAAPTGQAIAVDASTLEQQARVRKAWFRLTNPGEAQPLANAYLLRIDCASRTIEALARRRQDASGLVSDYQEYPPGSEGPMAVEGGTVMEIAYLAMCT